MNTEQGAIKNDQAQFLTKLNTYCVCHMSQRFHASVFTKEKGVCLEKTYI